MRGSPAAADAASCSGVKRAGIQATEAAAPEKRRSAFEASELGIPQSIVTSLREEIVRGCDETGELRQDLTPDSFARLYELRDEAEIHGDYLVTRLKFTEIT